MSITPSSRFLKNKFSVFFIIFIVSAFFLGRTVKTTSYFNPDEPWWISISSATTDWIAHGDFSYATWRAPGYTADISVTSPPVAKYLMGFSLRLSGFKKPLWYPWDWSKTKNENVALGNLPSAKILAAARLPSVIAAAITISLIGYLVFLCTNNWITVTFSCLSLGLHPIFLDSARFAMLDMPAAALSTLGVLLMIGL